MRTSTLSISRDKWKLVWSYWCNKNRNSDPTDACPTIFDLCHSFSLCPISSLLVLLQCMLTFAGLTFSKLFRTSVILSWIWSWERPPPEAKDLCWTKAVFVKLKVDWRIGEMAATRAEEEEEEARRTLGAKLEMVERNAILKCRGFDEIEWEVGWWLVEKEELQKWHRIFSSTSTSHYLNFIISFRFTEWKVWHSEN